jgi:hypothetical protein
MTDVDIFQETFERSKLQFIRSMKTILRSYLYTATTVVPKGYHFTNLQSHVRDFGYK